MNLPMELFASRETARSCLTLQFSRKQTLAIARPTPDSPLSYHAFTFSPHTTLHRMSDCLHPLQIHTPSRLA